MKIGYKVVEPICAEVFQSATSSAYKLFYQIDMPTIRNKNVSGPIAVFDKYNNAKDFIWIHDLDTCVILKITYIESNESNLWKRDKIGNKYIKYYNTLPTGTILAESVTPIKILKREPFWEFIIRMVRYIGNF